MALSPMVLKLLLAMLITKLVISGPALSIGAMWPALW
jgi:hypothetical protein